VRDRMSLLRSKRVISAACLLALLIAAAPASAAPIVTLSPSTSSVTPGGTFTIDVLISDAMDLFLFQIGIRYDSEVFTGLAMSPGSVQLSPPLDPFPSPDNNFDPVDDIGEAFYLDIMPIDALAGIDVISGSLLHVTFAALALEEGVTSVSSEISFFIGDEFRGDGFFDSFFNPIPIGTVEPVSVRVEAASVPVPEPSGLALFAIGAATTSVAARRRKQFSKAASARNV
jgi:hypothetical protein